jgi:hypothetical protein
MRLAFCVDGCLKIQFLSYNKHGVSSLQIPTGDSVREIITVCCENDTGQNTAFFVTVAVVSACHFSFKDLRMDKKNCLS